MNNNFKLGIDVSNISLDGSFTHLVELLNVAMLHPATGLKRL